ncbi:hypothetical protein CEP54_011994 [Fusarium duplospermum]|uniref:Uncharacterized protein n=1 Tax=Fusarium duplospermum TaxID=1325734 RepID=A0A428PBB5_9HYPO|nr:hypothetical protein CEP54_011994 [Fusarium duplospermum]
MRLINTKTLQLKEFNGTNRPPYAILSHTWGDQEVTFQDMQEGAGKHSWKAGFRKIVQTCRVARRSRIKYAWVDTCCIDKSSSAELSEAINSMFRWYEDSEICYAYLPDVHGSSCEPSDVVRSCWFTRGWTLQELIAPRNLVFYASNWQCIDFRSSLGKIIADSTGIDERLLQDNRAKPGRILRSSSIAQRMSWASKRETTRTEDLAYCLLGIFDINMPLLYGEGTKAFTRLQEEIIRHTDDQSIFAWSLPIAMENDFDTSIGMSVFAPSPKAFVASRDIVPVDTGDESAPFSLTNRGIRINLCLQRNKGSVYGIIPCRRNKETNLLRIELLELSCNRFLRVPGMPMTLTNYLSWKQTSNVPVYLVTGPPPQKHRIPPGSFLVRPLPSGIAVSVVSQGHTWSPETGLITSDNPEDRFGRETELRLVLKSTLDGSHPYTESTNISVWVRRPSEHDGESEWVTYDVRYSSLEGQLRMSHHSFGSFFAKVERQVVFGQRAIVIEVFSWENENGILKQLRWDQMRLGRLLDRCLFGVLGVQWSWLIILWSKEIQSLAICITVLAIAFAFIM